jgi:hypothetical protein
MQVTTTTPTILSLPGRRLGCSWNRARMVRELKTATTVAAALVGRQGRELKRAPTETVRCGSGLGGERVGVALCC